MGVARGWCPYTHATPPLPRLPWKNMRNKWRDEVRVGVLMSEGTVPGSQSVPRGPRFFLFFVRILWREWWVTPLSLSVPTRPGNSSWTVVKVSICGCETDSSKLLTLKLWSHPTTTYNPRFTPRVVPENVDVRKSTTDTDLPSSEKLTVPWMINIFHFQLQFYV